MVDPYDWFGIPAADRPPTHYDLLGIDVAADASAIRAAAERRIATLLPHLAGENALEAERVWVEVEEARDTLLDADRRTQYDTRQPETPSEPEGDAPPDPPPTLSDEELSDATLPEPEPWWKTHPPAAGAATRHDWWQQPLPPDAPAPARTAPTWIASVPPLDEGPAHPPQPFRPTKQPELPPLVQRERSTRSTLPLLVGGLVVAVLAGVGVFLAFGNKKTSTPTIPNEPPAVSRGTTDPPVPKPAPTEEPPVDPPLPKDFVDTLRPKVFAGHDGAVTGVAVSASGTRFASVGNDQTVRLWSPAKENSTTRHRLISPGVGVRWCDGDRTLAAADGLTLFLIPANSEQSPKGLESPRGGVTAMAVTADGGRGVTGIKEGYVRSWDAAAGRFDEWALAANGPVTAMDVSVTGLLVAAVAEGPVSVWNLSTRARLHEWAAHAGGAIAAAFSPDGSRVATTSAAGVGSVFDLTSKKEVCRVEGHVGPIAGVAWLPDGRRIATVGVDGTARLWSADNGQPSPWVRPLDGKGTCIAVDPQGRFLLAGTSTGSIHLLPLPLVRPEPTLEAEAAPKSPLPVPDATAAVAEVQKDYLRDYSFTRPDDRAQLAENLRLRGLSKGIATAKRFALLSEARTLALASGDVATTFRVIDDLSRWFDVDELAAKADAFDRLRKVAEPGLLHRLGAETAERAETDARPEVVERIAAHLPNDPPRYGELRKRASATLAERQAVRDAMALLKNAPSQPAANLAFGKHLAFARGEWPQALPHLALGSDPKLLEAAKADALGASDPKAQHRLGETWLALARDATDHRSKRALARRARTWFERELAQKLETADQIKARIKVDDIAKLDVPGKPGDLIPYAPIQLRRGYDTAHATVASTDWRLDGGAEPTADGVSLPGGSPGMRSRFGLDVGGSLSLSVRGDGREVRLLLAGQEVAFAGGGSLRIVIQRDAESVTVTVVTDGGEPLVRKLDLAPAFRGPTFVSFRLTGSSERPGARLASAIVRGPATLPQLTIE